MNNLAVSLINNGELFSNTLARSSKELKGLEGRLAGVKNVMKVSIPLIENTKSLFSGLSAGAQVLNYALNSTSEGAKALRVSMDTLNTTTGVLFESIFNANFDSLEDGFGSLIQRVHDYHLALENLGQLQESMTVIDLTYSNKKDDYKATIANKNLSKEEREEAYNNWKNLYEKGYSKENSNSTISNLQSQVIGVINDAIKKNNSLESNTPVGISDIISAYESMGDVGMKANLEKQYQEYLKQLSQLQGNDIKTSTTLGSVGAPYHVTYKNNDDKDKERKAVASLKERNKEAILYGTIWKNISEEERASLVEMIQMLYQKENQAKQYRLELEKSAKILNQIEKEEIGSDPSMIKSKPKSKSKRIDAGLPIQAHNSMFQELKSEGGLKEMDGKKNKKGNGLPFEQVDQSLLAGLNQMDTIMGSISMGLNAGTDNWLSFSSTIMMAVAQALPALHALFTQGFASAIVSAAAVGFPQNVAAMLTTAATITSVIASVPKFANGGIVYGRTIAEVGEYAGASSNPEVIAPLSKLRALIAPQDNRSGIGQVNFKIKGRDIVGILETHNRYQNRIR